MSDELTKLDRVEDVGLFERVIRADERAQEAHRRLDRHDEFFEKIEARMTTIETGVGDLKVAVGMLNVKVGAAAALGSLLGAAVLKFVG